MKEKQRWDIFTLINDVHLDCKTVERYIGV